MLIIMVTDKFSLSLSLSVCSLFSLFQYLLHFCNITNIIILVIYCYNKSTEAQIVKTVIIIIINRSTHYTFYSQLILVLQHYIYKTVALLMELLLVDDRLLDKLLVPMVQ